MARDGKKNKFTFLEKNTLLYAFVVASSEIILHYNYLPGKRERDREREKERTNEQKYDIRIHTWAEESIDGVCVIVFSVLAEVKCQNETKRNEIGIASSSLNQAYLDNTKQQAIRTERERRNEIIGGAFVGYLLEVYRGEERGRRRKLSGNK